MSTPPPYVASVAVLFGGRSSEHEISLRSAVFVLQSLSPIYRIIPVGINREGQFYSVTGVWNATHFQKVTTEDLACIVNGQVPALLAGGQTVPSLFLPLRVSQIPLGQASFWRILNTETDCVFPVMHGANAEDGRLQGLFELAELAYVGCDIRASVLGIDKDLQKRIAQQAGVAVARYEVVLGQELAKRPADVFARIEARIGYPCFVKPNAAGSAIGAHKARDRQQLMSALEEAFAFDEKAIVEELLVGTEVECAFLGSALEPRITVAGEIQPKEFYSYEEKYASSSEASLYLPARLSPDRMTELKALALRIAQAMGIEGFSRIDFWNLQNPNRFVFNEYNTIPGLTSISMFPKLWEYEGLSGTAWMHELIVHAQNRRQALNKLQFGITCQKTKTT